MTNTTAPISPLFKELILDAMRDALDNLNRMSRSGRGDDSTAADERRERAKANADLLVWATARVIRDEHDSLLSLRIGGCTVALDEMAAGDADPRLARAAARRLHLAACLLFCGRRERDLQGRLDAILPAVQDLKDEADELVNAVNGTDDEEAIAALDQVIDLGTFIAIKARA